LLDKSNRNNNNYNRRVFWVLLGPECRTTQPFLGEFLAYEIISLFHPNFKAHKSSSHLECPPTTRTRISRILKQTLHKVDLNNCAQNYHYNLSDGPCLNITGVVLDQVEISGFSSSRHGLELPHHLNTLIHTTESAGEVLHCYVHVLEFLGKLFPLVIPEGGDVEVDQLGAEPGELVVQADAVVSPTDDITLLVF